MNNFTLDQIYKLNLNAHTTLVFSEKNFKKISKDKELDNNYIDFLDENLNFQNKYSLVKKLLNYSLLLGMNKWSFFDVEINNDNLVSGVDPALNDEYQDYCWNLLSSCITTGATPLVADYLYKKFIDLGLFHIADHFKKMKLEEGPHKKLCIADLKDLEINHKKIFSLYKFEKEESMVKYFWKLAKSNEPLATLGYAYALEKTALIFNTPERVQEIVDLLGSKASATRCIKAHMSTSHEKEHVEQSLRLIATFKNKTIGEIVKATFETSSKMNNPFLNISKLNKVL